MLSLCTLLSNKMIISLREKVSEVVIANPYNAVLENWRKTKEYPPIPIVAWRRQWHPTPVFLPGKSHGRRSLVGCTPWEQSDTTERLHFDFSLSCIGEGNGNPLQCSCLENPRDGGAWWAAIYGVAQSQTWLKWLSSSIGASYPILAVLPIGQIIEKLDMEKEG